MASHVLNQTPRASGRQREWRIGIIGTTLLALAALAIFPHLAILTLVPLAALAAIALWLDRTVVRRERERDLLRSQLDRVLDRFEAVTWTTDAALRITSSYGSGLLAIGRAPGQDVDASLADLFPAGSQPLHTHRAALGGASGGYTLEVAGRQFAVSVEPIRRGGEIIGCSGVGVDATERSAIERELSRSVARQRVLRAMDRTLVSAGSMADLVRQIAPLLEGLLPIVALCLILDEWDELSEALYLDAAGEVLSERLPTGATVPSIIGLGRHAVVASAALPEPLAALLGPAAERVYIAPVESGGLPIGALLLVINAVPPPIDVPLMVEVCEQLSQAVERLQLFEQVRTGRERLADLTSQLIEAHEVERRFIACELHDEVGQSLTGLKLMLEVMRRSASPAIAEQLRESTEIVNDLLSRVRDLSLDLRPSMLDDAGLLPTLTWLCGRFSSRTGVAVELHHSGADQRFPPQIETAAYRIVQEALTNVARHAQAESALVQLYADKRSLRVQVIDCGRGFDRSLVFASGQSVGLAGMRERVDLLGGRLQIETAPGDGVHLTADLPREQPLERRRRER